MSIIIPFNLTVFICYLQIFFFSDRFWWVFVEFFPLFFLFFFFVFFVFLINENVVNKIEQQFPSNATSFTSDIFSNNLCLLLLFWGYQKFLLASSVYICFSIFLFDFYVFLYFIFCYYWKITWNCSNQRTGKCNARFLFFASFWYNETGRTTTKC